jgi:carbamoyltransferase
VPTILGINMSHASGACLFIDGRLVAAVSEERLNRKKFSADFPQLSIMKVMEIGGVTPGDIDEVAIGTRCEMFDSNKAQAGEYRKTTRMVSWASRLLPVSVVESNWLKQFYIYSLGAVRRYQFMTQYLPFFIDIGIPKSKLKYYDHHTCHAAVAYFLSPFRKKTLIFTCDGNGDGDCATVWIGENDSLECKLRIPSVHSLGGLVARTTRFMGMSPWQDEYKVMGLAPWGELKTRKAAKAYETFKKIWELDGLGFKNRIGYAGDALIPYLERHMRSFRFDHLAYGIQKLVEDILTGWVQNNMEYYAISDMTFAGGVFLNVKANKRICELPQTGQTFWFPAAGDDSVAIGAGILATIAHQKAQNLPVSIEPMTNPYWGEPIDKEIESFINSSQFNGFNVTRPENINQTVAELLAENQIVARCSGRMEFGPRALGNRSILANGSNPENVRILNAMIKNRDFWMPFAGTVLDSASDRYLINPKHIPSPYMILSFDTVPENWKDIQAATHQADFTIRPQILTKDFNPDYHDLISRFENKTGIGAVLNTSLNLHGEPMVNLPEEAMAVMTRSALKYLVLGNWLISKND